MESLTYTLEQVLEHGARRVLARVERGLDGDDELRQHWQHLSPARLQQILHALQHLNVSSGHIGCDLHSSLPHACPALP